MSLTFLYWFMILLIVLFGGWFSFRPSGDRLFGGWSLILLIIFIIIGLKLFGQPIQP
jgi:hypothetical protein